VRTPAAPLTDLDVVARRLCDELTASALSETDALRTIAQLEPDGSWPDIDYTDRSRTHWSPAQHPRRLAQLAAAYSAHLYAPDQADELEQAILSGLAFWVEADPQSDNGRYNRIDTPKYLAQTLLLMGDTVPWPTWERATAIVRRSGLTRTGTNLIWEAGNLLVLACATRDEPLLRQTTAAIAAKVRMAPEQGVQPDPSPHQHGAQRHVGNYGEVFRIDNSRYARLLAGTQYAFSDEQTDLPVG
jgi:chondroitin AC lyase